jgi:hypothetical protein
MPKPIQAIGGIRLDVLQALKRAYWRRGFMLGRQRRSKRSAQEAEAAEAVESKPLGARRSLEKQTPDSKSAKGPSNLLELTEKSQDVLYEATSVFPFTLFPDSVILDREKLTIANRFFWRTANITSTPVSEIMSCETNVGPFFGSLHFTFRFFTDNQRTISFLPRKDATEMQRLVHGYIIAHRREIDCSDVNKEDLITMLTELGQGASD